MEEIDDRFFKQAHDDLENNRDDALWYKCLAIAKGDEVTARAEYIGIRARRLSEASVEPAAAKTLPPVPQPPELRRISSTSAEFQELWRAYIWQDKRWKSTSKERLEAGFSDLLQSKGLVADVSGATMDYPQIEEEGKRPLIDIGYLLQGKMTITRAFVHFTGVFASGFAMFFALQNITLAQQSRLLEHIPWFIGAMLVAFSLTYYGMVQSARFSEESRTKKGALLIIATAIFLCYAHTSAWIMVQYTASKGFI